MTKVSEPFGQPVKINLAPFGRWVAPWRFEFDPPIPIPNANLEEQSGTVRVFDLEPIADVLAHDDAPTRDDLLADMITRVLPDLIARNLEQD